MIIICLVSGLFSGAATVGDSTSAVGLSDGEDRNSTVSGRSAGSARTAEGQRGVRTSETFAPNVQMIPEVKGRMCRNADEAREGWCFLTL